MNKKNILIIILLSILIIKFYPTYIPLYPSIPIYPDNYDEVLKVKKYIKYRTKKDIEFFNKTNINIIPAFLPYIKESYQEINNIILSVIPIIILFKYLINRARPNQIDNSIIPIDTSTAQTPAFPAGHAFQAYYLSKILSKKYPSLKKTFEYIASECDLTRVKAGLHYPSDGQFSKFLVDSIY